MRFLYHTMFNVGINEQIGELGPLKYHKGDQILNSSIKKKTKDTDELKKRYKNNSKKSQIMKH